MKKILLLAAVVCVFAAAAAWAAEHPVEMNGNDCLYCHEENSKSDTASSSVAGKEWASSLHGIESVPCVTCHGDESTFRPASVIDNCKACHPGESANTKNYPKAKKDKIVCVECHKAHTFTAAPAKKGAKPVHGK